MVVCMVVCIEAMVLVSYLSKIPLKIVNVSPMTATTGVAILFIPD